MAAPEIPALADINLSTTTTEGINLWHDAIRWTERFVPLFIGSLIILLFFWLLSIGAQRLVNRLGRFRGIDEGLVVFLGRGTKLALLVFGIITAIGTLGVDVTALVAGLGLTGFALGFAFKDIVSNALAGILIIMYRPFRRSDRISVTGLDGAVIDINLRYTVLEAPDKRIFLPNSTLFTNPVIVFSPTAQVLAPVVPATPSTGVAYPDAPPAPPPHAPPPEPPPPAEH
jgi:small-conductance mechanosensitive channel